MGYLLPFFNFLAMAFAASQPSSNISSPTAITTSSQMQIKQADVSVPFRVPIPSHITSLVQADVAGQGCYIAHAQAGEQRLNFVEVPVDEEQISGNDWMTQVMSFSLDKQSSTLFVLLDNGTLLEYSPFSLKSANGLNTAKSYSRGRVGATNTWFESHHRVISFDGQLFMLAMESLHQVSLNSSGYWEKGIKPIAENVISVKQNEGKLYILTNDELFSFSNVKGRTSLRRGGKFQDFVFIKKTLFLLDKQSGLIQASGEGKSQKEVIWSIEGLQDSVRLAGIEQTLMMVFEIKHHSYIGQYFIEEENIVLNRYYHNYQRVRDIHLAKNYAIIDAYTQYIIMHHSINRHSFSKLTPVQFIVLSNSTKISGVHLIDDPSTFSFLVGLKNSVQMKNIHTASSEGNYGINNMGVECISKEPKKVQASFNFKGPCSSNYSPRNYFCQVKIPIHITFRYSHDKKNTENHDSKHIIRLILLILVVFSLIFCLVCRAKLKKLHRKLREEAMLLREKREKHGINMEQTFIPG